MSESTSIIPTRVTLAKKKRKVFLRVLSLTGRVSEASRAAGFTDTSSLQTLRRNDEDFAEEWQYAVDAAADTLEEEAMRRAHDGVLEPVYYKGEVVGFKTNYSDALLMFILRGLRPDKYRETVRGGGTTLNFGIAVLPMTAQNDDQWEQRAVIMHDNQKPIILEAKPVENNMRRVNRGD